MTSAPNDEQYTMLFIERGASALVNDEKRPVLYDARDRPLTRPTGFRPSTER